MVNLEHLRQMIQSLPETSENSCYATPGLYVRGKLFARVREDGTSLAIKVLELERLLTASWSRAAPRKFLATLKTDSTSQSPTR